MSRRINSFVTEQIYSLHLRCPLPCHPHTHRQCHRQQGDTISPPSPTPGDQNNLNRSHEFVYFKQFLILFVASFLIFFLRYNIDTIQRYSRQHHSSSSATNTLFLSVSFKPAFVDFTLVLHMLALSVVLILPSSLIINLGVSVKK